ncbi:hypothetical protein AB2B41_10010 [Marimonas sp. MJW-29]|uniref:Uncharacterized protein n=1 Tax=Sulfitobacter sediminis TaxID=3234186 RepID=A0ABV3RLV4_9RHOB
MTVPCPTPTLPRNENEPRHAMRILITLTALTLLAACDVPFVPLV